MVEYKCNTCGKNWTHRGTFERHQNRKIPCSRKLAGVSQKLAGKKVYEEAKKNEKLADDFEKLAGKNEKTQCRLCGKRLLHKSSLSRHMRGRCPVIIERDREREEIFQSLMAKMKGMEDEMNEMKKGPKKIVNNSTQNINNNTQNITNVQNNIKLVAFGKEDMKKLKHDDVVPLLRGYYTPVHMTEFMHFNPEKPEYHNVYISNIKDKYAMVFNGTEWELMSKERVVDDLYQEKKDHVEENLETFLESLSGPKQRALRRWLDTPDEDVRVKRVKDEIKLLLYNKRNIPMKGRFSNPEIEN